MSDEIVKYPSDNVRRYCTDGSRVGDCKYAPVDWAQPPCFGCLRNHQDDTVSESSRRDYWSPAVEAKSGDEISNE